MKSSNIVTLLTATTTAALSPNVVSSFEIHTEELLSHSILARLILESPSRRAAIATRQSSAMAFLEKKAADVEPQLAFLSERDAAASSSSQEQLVSSSDVVEVDAEKQEGEKTQQPQQQVPLAFGLAPR